MSWWFMSPRQRCSDGGNLSLHPQLLEALSRPVEHSVELQAGQTVVGLDALLALLPEVVPAKEVAVPLHRQLVEDLTNQPDLLGACHQLRRVGLVILQPGQTERAVAEDLACALVVAGRKVPRERAHEGRELRRITDRPGAHPLEEDAHHVLVQIVADGAVARHGAEDGADAAAEALDQIPLGVGIPGADALHQ